MEHVAILLAGGSGNRMGQSVEDKILFEVAGRPVFAHVLEAFAKSASHDAFVIVYRDDVQRKALKAIASASPLKGPFFYTVGGNTRVESVRQGLNLLPSATQWVTIHDCARPATDPNAIRELNRILRETNGPVSLAHRATDTLRQFAEDPSRKPAAGTCLQRDRIWAMETPQGFPRKQLEDLHQTMPAEATDDISAFENAGIPISIVESHSPNPKLTRPADLPLLEKLLATKNMQPQAPLNFRVGLGYDIHRLKEGLPLVLGGVKITSDCGLEGHSDADVLVHALSDAILGSVGLPDIGHFFPNNDPTIEGISSLKILERCIAEAQGQGFRILNCDASLIAEKPRIGPYIAQMKSTLAGCMGIDPKRIGIKATTQEGIGALGQAKGIAAHAVVMMQEI